MSRCFLSLTWVLFPSSNIFFVIALSDDRYHCPECGITHLGDCRASDLGDPENEMDKRRICHECNPSRRERGEEVEGSSTPKSKPHDHGVTGIGSKKRKSRKARPGAGIVSLTAPCLDPKTAASMELCK